MWQYRTIYDDDGDDEGGKEPPQAEDHVYQPAPQGPVPPIPYHDQMFGFQELQEGLNSLRIHMDQRLDNLSTWIPGLIICRHIWIPDWNNCRLIWTLQLIISKCMWTCDLKEWNREWIRCKTKLNEFCNNMIFF